MRSKKAKKPTIEELLTTIRYTSKTAWQNELPKKNLDDWLDNFKGEIFDKEKERFIALWLLNHFTYYNHVEVTHLCKVLFNNLIHIIVTKFSDPKKSVNDIVEDFFKKTNIIPAEEVSGSSGFIAYFFRHVNQMDIDLFNFSIENVGDHIENIIVIDDVTLTAGKRGQMSRFLKAKTQLYPKKNFYLITLISSEASIDYFNKDFNVEVITTIKLDARDKCFSKQSNIFTQFPDLLEDCRLFAEHYGKKIRPKNPLGYGDGQYAFGFFYNTPNNTLPIFWGEVKGWKPVIRRFHKHYGSKKFLKNERFI